MLHEGRVQCACVECVVPRLHTGFGPESEQRGFSAKPDAVAEAATVRWWPRKLNTRERVGRVEFFLSCRLLYALKNGSRIEPFPLEDFAAAAQQ